jgi:hypothetical protein
MGTQASPAVSTMQTVDTFLGQQHRGYESWVLGPT